MKKWMVPFAVRRFDLKEGRKGYLTRNPVMKWGVFERRNSCLRLVSYWDTREQAREAVRQLNQEERRYA